MNKASLHNHDPYGSLLDSIATVEELVSKAKECEYSSIAITNHGKMSSTIAFYKECLKQDIKPIIGLEAYQCEDIEYKDDTRFHLILLAKNNDGLKALYKLSSWGYIKGFYKKPRIDLNSIKPYAKDLIVLSGCLAGQLSKLLQKEVMYEELILKVNEKNFCENIIQPLLKKNQELSLMSDWLNPYVSNLDILLGLNILNRQNLLRCLNEYKSICPDFYIEMQSHDIEDQIVINKKLLELAKETNTKFVLTDDTHYVNKEDIAIQGVFLKISQDRDVGETYTDCYIKNEKEIHKIMDKQIGAKNVDIAIKNSADIADMCNISIDLDAPNQMPEIKIPSGYTSHLHYYKYLLNEGWNKRGVNKLPKAQREIRKERLLKEIDTLEYLGYIDYFLMLKQLVDEARNRKIPLGSSRGSGGNCYSLYLLGITEVDSVFWDLDFSRFATKGRKSVADYDLDCSKNRRKEMIQICRDMFDGIKEVSEDLETLLESKVIPICNFNSLSTKVAIRDIGKVLNELATKEFEEGITNQYERYIDLDYSIRDEVAKLIPVIKDINELGEEVEVEKKLREVIEDNVQLKKYYKKYPLWFDYTIKLEGLPKTMSTHAAGIIIAPKPVVEYLPLCYNKTNDLIAQYDMYCVLDDLHLIKLDILGLVTIDQIDETLKLSNLTWDDIATNKLDFEDKKVYDSIYKDGNCAGIFQFESYGCIQMCQDVKCNSMSDVIAINAANRPGTKDFFPTYVENKLDPSNLKLIHEDLAPIVKSTHGVLLYQEQILAIFRLANFPEESVDIARKGIGKKDAKLMASLKDKLSDFTEDDRRYGLKQRGWSKKQIDEVWDIILKQASYSFNKGHSTAYGINSYWTAYLKTYYPTQFMTALLNSEQGNFGQISKYIHECKRMNIKILEPLVNYSEQYFSIKDQDILFGLSMIKGLGDKGVEELLATRPYLSLTDYIDKAKLNCSSTVALIKSGSFKEFEPSKTKALKVFRELNFDGCKFKEVIKSGSKKDMLELGLIQKEDEFKEKEKCLTIWNNYKRSLFDIKENAKIEKHNEEFNVKYMEGNELDWQMETLSMYLNENPYQNLIDNGTIQPYDNIINLEKGIVVGTILDIKKKNNKKTGRTYAFVDVINHEGQIVECGFWYKGYENYQYLLKRGNKIISTGKKDGKRFFIEECDLYKEWLKKVGINKKI